jgi:hypothetical protein
MEPNRKHHIQQVNAFHIASDDSGFQVIETYPDGRKRFHGGFATERAASDWMTDHLGQMNMVDLARWLRERVAQPFPTYIPVAKVEWVHSEAVTRSGRRCVPGRQKSS